ncbi:hypothetical protein WRP3_033 [Lactococcus phage WRP3]|uniref:Uncharacterized protein n=2 Tax=Audreyjarvisvirus TaxID=2843351 RepID=V9VEQ6_9CAUD|nr:hypothetical protein T548_0040 [Lactococcus phage phiL47]YP_009147690.1 hypothetical protein ACQ37_gp033 [Lactococcus phage WRP3]AHC94118.1 hypothetical protein T548_0040 [Lactococcus phage phiL47]AIX12536.1 hypothetical protein WRP3_033 [Lactococcus phage WRP3]
MEKFTKLEALESILEVLEDGYTGELHDLFDEVFNRDYYIIGTYEAKKALENYGTFEAIEKVHNWEIENFGECSTDLANPEHVSNMLFYIIGWETIEELETIQNNSGSLDDDELLKELTDEINELIESEK